MNGWTRKEIREMLDNCRFCTGTGHRGFIECYCVHYMKNNQPERLNPETPIPEYGAKSSPNFDEWQRRCDSLTSMET